MSENDIVSEKVVTETVKLKIIEEKGCTADVLRLDKIHPVISGNKWFKLKYNLEEAKKQGKSKILTFGGYYSNHIIATALAARQHGLKATGIIRGEEPKKLSHTLLQAQEFGMNLKFFSRKDYDNKADDNYREIRETFSDAFIIPEGGANPDSRKGAGEILQLTDAGKYSHILCATGTGTMFTGLADASRLNQKIIGITVLKVMVNLMEQYGLLLDNPEKRHFCKILYDYSFGGYAKKTPELISFMNELYEQTGVPTDFVYTGKLFYAFTDLLKQDYFPPGSNILMIHSGGLQGNLSLPEGTLKF